MWTRPRHREEDEAGRPTRDDAVAAIAVVAGSAVTVLGLLAAPLSSELAVSGIAATTLIAVWLIARRPAFLTRWVQHASSIAFRWIAIAAALIVVGATAVPGLVYAQRQSKENQTAESAPEISLSLANSTRGDVEWSDTISAEVGDHVEANIWVRNQLDSEPLEASLSWTVSRASGSVWVLDVTVDAPGASATATAAITVRGSGHQMSGSEGLVGDYYRAVLATTRALTPDSGGNTSTVEIPLRAGTASSDAVQLPTLYARPGSDQLSVTFWFLVVPQVSDDGESPYPYPTDSASQ